MKPETFVRILAAALALGGAATAQEKIEVVTTTPTLRWLVEEVGGGRVEVTSLGRGNEDPHFVTPTPTLMVKANGADLFVEFGFSLELWAENVLDGARNSRIRRGQSGHVYAGQGIRALEVPGLVSRAEGDVHSQGNPHVWLDPSNVRVLAANVAEALSRIDPAGKAEYGRRRDDLARRIDEAMYGRELVDLLGAEYLHRLQESGELIQFLSENDWEGRPLLDVLGGWRKKMLPLRGSSYVSYHRMWPYFANAFELDFVEQLEPKPGISPTPAHLARVKDVIRSRKVRALVCAPYYDFSKIRSVAEEVGLPAIRVPTDVGGDEHATDYFRLIDRMTDLLVQPAGG